MLAELRSSDFAAHLNEPFEIQLDGYAPIPLTLGSVTELGEQTKDGLKGPQRRPFSLVFWEPRNLYLPQAIYPLYHETLGQLKIFLVPIGPDGAGMRYEAIFT